MTKWLMVEVIAFYSYIVLECLTAGVIFAVMLRRHNKRFAEEAALAASKVKRDDGTRESEKGAT